MSEHYGAIAPDMPAKQGRAEAFDECYAIAADAVQQHQPQLIVGSSFGGAILMRLLREEIWFGASIFLAQAGVLYGLGDRLPEGVPAILIHSRADELIPFEHSQRLAENSGNTVHLWEANGDHRLHNIVSDGTLIRAIETLLPSSRFQ